MASRAPHRFLLIWSALAAAGGCGQLLGISDYDIDPSLNQAAGGEGGNADPGTAGKISVAGKSSGGEPAEGGKGGNAGEPMMVGGAGTSGAGGAGGAPPLGKFVGCDGTPFEGNEAIVRSCILRVGCMYWNYPADTISRCVSQNAQATYAGTACSLDATTCEDMTACEGTRLEPTFCGSGATKKEGMYCDGNEIVDCDAFVPYARDCTKEGGTCHDFGVDLDGKGTTVACSVPSITTCAATTTEKQCSASGYSYLCEGDIAYGTKCSNFATVCEDIGSGNGCYYPLNGCPTEGVTCANGRATWCDGDSKATFDCGSVGLGCETSGDYFEDNNRQCAAPGCTADDIVACEESCDGTNLTFCYGGAPITVDCKDYGFKKCKEYDYNCTDDYNGNDCVLVSDDIHYAECE